MAAIRKCLIAAAFASLAGDAAIARAQAGSSQRIPIRKDPAGTSSALSGGEVTSSSRGLVDTVMMNGPIEEWYFATAPACTAGGTSAARAGTIAADGYDPARMISPDSAKVLALCALPGRVAGGRMTSAGGRTEYVIDVIPSHRRTRVSVVVDASNGAVLSSAAFGGLRGLSGWIPEPAERPKP